MRRKSGLIVAWCLLLPTSGLVALEQSRRPGEVLGISVDAPPPPPSLEAVWQSASLVVQGRVLETTTRPLASGGSVIDFRVRIQSVLKEDPQRAPSSDVTVTIKGGVIQSPRGPIRTTGTVADEISVGDDGLFLLAPVPTATEYAPVNLGFFAIRNGLVLVPEAAQRLPGIEGRNAIAIPDFVAVLRKVR